MAMLWDHLDLETQLTLIQARLVDPALVAVERTSLALPRLVITESRDELERLMQQRPHYTIFNPTPRSLRSLRLKHG